MIREADLSQQFESVDPVNHELDPSALQIVERMGSISISKEIREKLKEMHSEISMAKNGSAQLYPLLTRSMQEMSALRKDPAQEASVLAALDLLGYVRGMSRKPLEMKKVFESILDAQRERFKNQERIEKKFDAQLELLLLKYCEKVNEGKNGVIFKIEAKNIPQKILAALKEQGIDLSENPEHPAAMKMLKIFDPQAVEHEFEMQKKAAESVPQHHPEQYAAIPKPWFTRTIEIEDPKVMKKMEDAGVLSKLQVHQQAKRRSLSILMMDFVAGDDLATHLYKWVLKKKNFGESEIAQMNFKELQGVLQVQLGFEKPKIGGSESEEFQVSTDNGKKLFEFLTRKGFKLHPNISRQVRNTVLMWNGNNFFHNDLHLRNILVEGEIEDKPGIKPKSYIIDFGTADRVPHENVSDLTAIATLEEIHLKNK